MQPLQYPGDRLKVNPGDIYCWSVTARDTPSNNSQIVLNTLHYRTNTTYHSPAEPYWAPIFFVEKLSICLCNLYF